MRKKENHPSHHNQPSSKLFIITSAFKHYERDRIDSTAVHNLNCLIHSLTLRILKHSNQPDVAQLVKITNQLIVGFLANLSEQTYRHTCTHEDIINFFVVMTSYFQKSVNAFGMNDTVIKSGILSIFSPIGSKALDSPKGMNQSKIQLINNLIQSIEEPKKEKLNYGTFVRESYTMMAQSGQKELAVKEILIAFLRNSSVVPNFKPTLIKFMTTAMAEGLEEQFKKCLSIFQHVGSTFEERRINIENLLLRSLDCNNCINYLAAIQSCMNLSKLVTPANLPEVILRITDKLFSKDNLSANSLSILEELSQINLLEFRQANCEKLTFKGDHLVARFLEWILMRYVKKEKNQNNLENQTILLQKELDEQNYELKEEKFLEFVKKLSNKNIFQADQEKNSEVKKACQYFSQFIKNMCRHPSLREKLAIRDLQSLSILKSTQKWSNQTIRGCILQVIPPLISELAFNFKDKSALKHAIMLRAAELSATKCVQGSILLATHFKQIYFQMLQTQSLNYHYVLCFLFLKYQKEREGIRDLILDSILADLQREDKSKNSRNLILNLSLFLKSYDHLLLSQPIKYKVRQLSKNSENLVGKLDINQLLGVQPKQITSLRHNHVQFDSKVQKMKKMLNKQLSNFECKEHLNLLYSLIIAVNDLIELPENQEVEHSLLTQITSLRKRAILGEVYTIIHLLNQAIVETTNNYVFDHPKKIEIFLLLLKLQQLSRANLLVSNEDSEHLYALLAQYLMLANSSLNNELLENLNNFRTNASNYSYERYQGYIEERQIIKFYSESSRDAFQMHIIMCRIGFSILCKLMEMKGLPFSSLSTKLQMLIQLYNTQDILIHYGFASDHEQKLKYYIMLLLLQEKVRNGLPYENLVKKIIPFASQTKDIVLHSHASQQLAALQQLYPIDFFSICLTAIRQVLSCDERESRSLFQLVTKVIEEDDKKDCSLSRNLMRTLESELSSVVCKQILERAKRGLQLDNKEQFYEQSSILYKLVSKAIEKDRVHLVRLVEDLIELDCYTNSEQSAFILKQISYIFTYVEERSSEICEIIFNYILTLTEIFVGEQKLQISTFICNFFGLQVHQQQELNLNILEKPVNLTCGGLVNYKCLQCDQKKIICLGCSITCHQNHPICFLNIPVEYKLTKCQCSDIGSNNCKLMSKDNPHKHNPFFKPKDFPLYKPPAEGLMAPPPEIYERMKLISNPFPSRYSRESSLQGQERFESMSRYEIQSLIRQEELIEQEMRANQWYENIRKGNRDRDREEFFNRFAGSRVERMIDRDDYPGSYRMFIEGSEGRRPPKFPPHLEKEKEKEDSIRQIIEPEFADEDYEREMFQDIKVGKPETEESSTILKKYVLLPKFIELMVNFCNKKSDKTKALTSVDRWKINFNNPQVYKLTQGSAFKIHNSGSFTFDIRKQNAIHVSCVLIKKTVANNHRYVLLASSTEISVFSLQKVLLCISEMKMVPGYNSISRHSVSFEVHSLDFSPIDKNIFCASGLHNLALLNINNQGHISRTSFRYNVSNFYINKIKLTKMGIFVGIDKEIRVLNYSCRHFLTLRAQEAHTMIREWTIFEKAAGCQVLFVCPNGNIFTTDILASDQDKKEFVSKITDHRTNKTGVGVSMAAKDLPDFGKYLFAAFKDGSNILGRLEGDQLQDMVNMQLKGLKYEKNIFDSNFIIGHAEIVKVPQADQLYLICTVKKYFPPEMSFHQGILIAIKFKKDADKTQSSSEIIVLNDEVTCEFFKVIKVGKKNFIIYSVHSDGSVQVTALNKVSRQNIQEQLLSIRQNQQKDNLLEIGDTKLTQSLSALRKNIARQIKIQSLVNKPQINTSYSFREGTEVLKSGPDYTLIKHSETDFEFKYNSFTKIVTGFSVPFFGQVTLPTRTTSPTFQVGFTQLEALHFFGEGSFKFKYKRSEQKRYSRQSYCNSNNAHPRMMQRLQRIEKLSEYPDGDKLINNHLMSSILGFKEDTNNDIQFVGKALEAFKAKIPKFQEIFKSQADDQTSSIEKTALIIKMFLTKSLKDGNPCSQEEVLQLISGIKSIIASSSKRLFILLKEIVVLASQVYQKQTGRYFSVNQENYSLRVATENRVEHYFNILKVDISDNELNEFLSFLTDILEEDQDLMALYVSKYSGIFTQLHRRLKKADTEERAKALIQLYTFAYPILKYCSIPCSWILNSVCSITFSFFSSKAVRETLYQGFKRSKQISFQQWLKNVCNAEGVVQEVEPTNSREKQQVQQPKDQMVQIYNMYNRGQIDEQALFKMISEASKLQYERQQENQMALEEECQEVQPQLQKQMEVEENILNHNIALVQDLADQCTDSFNENVELTYSRIMTLYVLSKAIDKYFEQSTNHLLKRIKKMVADIDLKAEGDKLQSILSYASLFNRILNNSQYLKRNDGKKYPPYVEIEEVVNEKLGKIRLESVPKITKQPDLLGRIFKDEKAPFNISIAYALTSLLLFPCQASHALLSLQCYWLLPESKEFYSKKKDFSNITDGIESGNIQKVYQIAKQNPLIWQEYNNIYNKLAFVEQWIEQKRNNWQLALELISIYYQD